MAERLPQLLEQGAEMNIKELAEQAGFDIKETIYGEKVFVDGRGITKELIRFAELVAAAKREACAKLCDKAAYWDGHVAANCAAAIRARGDTK